MRCLSMAESALNRSSRNSNREYGRPLSMSHLAGKAMNRSAADAKQGLEIILRSALDAIIVTTLVFVSRIPRIPVRP
jgi:hypothetical protein